VAPYHLIVATKDFEPQNEQLNVSDIKALWYTVNIFDGLGFYNCGKVSGASQPHKHMQLIPLPLERPEGATQDVKFPMEFLLERSCIFLDL
jgi:ATP adenylyltransferase